MSALSSVLLLITAFFTATLSGIFGMAGGLLLMGALALVLPVQAAFVTHGLLQLVANGWTGAMAGERPYSWIKIAVAVLVGLIVLAIGAALQR